jgi:hypothetical protein
MGALKASPTSGWSVRANRRSTRLSQGARTPEPGKHDLDLRMRYLWGVRFTLVGLVHRIVDGLFHRPDEFVALVPAQQWEGNLGELV